MFINVHFRPVAWSLGVRERIGWLHVRVSVADLRRCAPRDGDPAPVRGQSHFAKMLRERPWPTLHCPTTSPGEAPANTLHTRTRLERSSIVVCARAPRGECPPSQRPERRL